VKDVIVFDEVAREGEGEPKFDAETIDTLKMFMQSGQYTEITWSLPLNARSS
jgi:predicted ATP-dependent Lon-type protease